MSTESRQRWEFRVFIALLGLIVGVAIVFVLAILVGDTAEIRCWYLARPSMRTYEWTFSHGCRIESSPAEYVPINEFLSHQPKKEQ